MMKIVLLGFLGLFLFRLPFSYAFPVYQKDGFSLDLKGYYKNLLFTSRRAATDAPYIADLNRLRTEWDAKFKILSAKVVWDNELIGGNYVATEEFAARQATRNEPFLDLDYEIARGGDFFYGQNLYRAYVQIDPGFLTFKTGRQKVDWGVMRLFSPVDLFTRLPIFDIEKDERVGATAANLSVPIGASLRINPVYAFHSDFDRSRVGARVTKTVGRFDVSVLGGRFLKDGVFGVDFSGEIKGAGVRGEFIFDKADQGGNFVQFASGVDYGFANSFYFAVEYFFNGRGTNNPLTAPRVPSGSQIASVHESFIGLQMKYDLTPLWTVSLENIVDLNGGSIFLNPQMKYEFIAWLVATAGSQLPVGRGGGEFTASPNVYYFQTQLFF